MKLKHILLALLIITSFIYIPEVESIGVHEETDGYTYGSIENDTHTSITEHKYYVYNDSYVFSYFANNNYGTDSNIAVYYGNIPGGPLVKRGLVISNLSSIPSENTTITSAFLYMRSDAYGSGTNDDQYIHRNTGSWSENSVTWNTKPSYNAGWTDVIDYNYFGFWRYWNVTDDVQSFVNGTHTNHGWTIKTQEFGSTVNPNYKSRETSYDPHVSVFYETRLQIILVAELQLRSIQKTVWLMIPFGLIPLIILFT